MDQFERNKRKSKFRKQRKKALKITKKTSTFRGMVFFYFIFLKQDCFKHVCVCVCVFMYAMSKKIERATYFSVGAHYKKK